MSHKFKMKNLGRLHYFVGVNQDITRIKRQQPYGLVNSHATKLFQKFEKVDCKPTKTPANLDAKLTSSEDDDHVCDQKIYQVLVGS